MKEAINGHTFHIPVMGIGFTIDTPVKVAKYGICSVMSMVDDLIVEKMREKYCAKFDFPFEAISTKIEDYRAKRFTAYFDVVDVIVKKSFEDLKNSIHETGTEVNRYMDLLPDISKVKKGFKELTARTSDTREIWTWLQDNLVLGTIDVNIMTKLDAAQFIKKEKQEAKFNDAHSALRGFANSKLQSGVVLSAGMNPRLYSYIGEFDDFFPDENGKVEKSIILKVSDYRSALIQGKFFAKKGLWVSEYRIESGLNCGGHAFASDGFMLGPILEEFRTDREGLISEIHGMLVTALEAKGRTVPKEPMDLKVTTQGGIGTSKEHEFLLDYYKVDKVGWASPFLLVPEVTNIDEPTRLMLRDAKEKDLYLSKTSPLGIPFNTLRGTSKSKILWENVAKGKPGSPCPKKYLVSNTEYTDIPICKSSIKYQKQKIEELDAQKAELTEDKYKKAYNTIVEKECICVGLVSGTLQNEELDIKIEGVGVSICPGPNTAYFSEIISMDKMVGHIYGKENVMTDPNRPNMFLKEIKIYIDYLRDKMEDYSKPIEGKDAKYVIDFKLNLNNGIEYYSNLIGELKISLEVSTEDFLTHLMKLKEELKSLQG